MHYSNGKLTNKVDIINNTQQRFLLPLHTALYTPKDGGPPVPSDKLLLPAASLPDLLLRDLPSADSLVLCVCTCVAVYAHLYVCVHSYTCAQVSTHEPRAVSL